MTQTGNERELRLVDRYLEDHFNPISRLLGHKIPDPEVRAICLRRCTRHIFHWQQDMLTNRDLGDSGEPVEPSHVMDDNGSLDLDEGLLSDELEYLVACRQVAGGSRHDDELVDGLEAVIEIICERRAGGTPRPEKPLVSSNGHGDPEHARR